MSKDKGRPGGREPATPAQRPLSQDPPLDDLRRFLFDHVASHEELGVLLLLVRGPKNDWSVESVAEALGAATDDCRRALAALETSGLVAMGNSDTYRYSPATEGVARAAQALERTYREQPATVAMMLSANAVARVRTSAMSTFAEAFRVRDGDKR